MQDKYYFIQSDIFLSCESGLWIPSNDNKQTPEAACYINDKMCLQVTEINGHEDLLLEESQFRIQKNQHPFIIYNFGETYFKKLLNICSYYIYYWSPCQKICWVMFYNMSDNRYEYKWDKLTEVSTAGQIYNINNVTN